MSKFNVAMILMAGILLVGCAQPQVVPQDHYYRLRLPSPAKVQAQPKLDGIVEIDRFSADGLVAGRPIVYSASDKPNQLMDYHYHFWTEPPTGLLRDQLIEYLRAAGIAKTVVTAEMRVAPDFIISGKIKRFEQVRDAAPHVVLEMELGLRQAGTDNLVYWGTYAKKVAAEGTTVADGVKAANIALSQVYSDYVRDLIK
ncbi:MAG: hypothetical protein HOF84_06120 [Rhodospirillales bacterium]|nr:hypothetical protein [Rhodospirillales bacterium]